MRFGQLEIRSGKIIIKQDEGGKWVTIGGKRVKIGVPSQAAEQPTTRELSRQLKGLTVGGKVARRTEIGPQVWRLTGYPGTPNTEKLARKILAILPEAHLIQEERKRPSPTARGRSYEKVTFTLGNDYDEIRARLKEEGKEEYYHMPHAQRTEEKIRGQSSE